MPETKQVIAPTSLAAIRLAQLAGFNADLGDALYGFTIALHMIESTVAWEKNVVRRLVSDAAVAYARCFTTSNVRPKLDTIIEVPAEHQDVHLILMKLRNRTVAHSESTLTPSFAVVGLARDESSGDVRAALALAMTAHVSFSDDAVQLFHDTTNAVKRLLLIEIETAKAQLLTDLNSNGDLVTLWKDGMQPQMVPISLDEWDVDSRRPDYPDSHVIPITTEPARTFLMPSGGHLYDARDLAGEDPVPEPR